MIMLSYEILMALRHLKSRKRSHAISLLTMISILGVMLGVWALIVVLAVLSGFGLAVLCLIIFIIIRVRENIEWERDDDDEDYDEDEGLDLDRTSKPLPVGMALDLIEDKNIVDATPEGLESELMNEIEEGYEIEDNSVEYEEEPNEDSGISVDDDGTEWYEDELGVWWYRDQDMEDWAEWTE